MRMQEMKSVEIGWDLGTYKRASFKRENEKNIKVSSCIDRARRRGGREKKHEVIRSENISLWSRLTPTWFSACKCCCVALERKLIREM